MDMESRDMHEGAGARIQGIQGGALFDVNWA